jgi:hypothetical protein
MPHKSIHVRFGPEQLRDIENFRRARADISSKPQAIRDLVEEALAAREAEAQVGNEPTAACAHHAVTNTKQTPRSQAAALHEFELVLNPGSTTTQKGSATYDANSRSKSRRQT